MLYREPLRKRPQGSLDAIETERKRDSKQQEQQIRNGPWLAVPAKATVLVGTGCPFKQRRPHFRGLDALLSEGDPAFGRTCNLNNGLTEQTFLKVHFSGGVPALSGDVFYEFVAICSFKNATHNTQIIGK